MNASSLVLASAPSSSAPREVLTLRLGREEYAIDILCVQEIRSFEQPIRLAGAPAHVLGMTHLRGVIVPIVDLRRYFELRSEIDSDTVTVVLCLAGRTVGVVVDAVRDVMALPPEKIRPAPSVNGATHAAHITGIATLSSADDPERMFMLLDIAALLADLGLIGGALAA